MKSEHLDAKINFKSTHFKTKQDNLMLLIAKILSFTVIDKTYLCSVKLCIIKMNYTSSQNI